MPRGRKPIGLTRLDACRKWGVSGVRAAFHYVERVHKVNTSEMKCAKSKAGFIIGGQYEVDHVGIEEEIKIINLEDNSSREKIDSKDVEKTKPQSIESRPVEPMKDDRGLIEFFKGDPLVITDNLSCTFISDGVLIKNKNINKMMFFNFSIIKRVTYYEEEK